MRTGNFLLRISTFVVAALVTVTTSASSLDALRASFAEAARASAATSDQVTRNFMKYSEFGRANDVLLLQLYTSIALPDDEVSRLLELWDGDQFTDIDYANMDRGRWQPTLHITRLQSVAKLYSDPDSNWYKNPKLHQMLHSGINWWFTNMPKCPNWWHNDIGVPKKMTTILLMIYDELSPEEIEGGVKVLERSKFGRTGQNKSWLAGNQLMKGMLLDDEELVLKARDVIAEEICITDSDEGIRDDWSFHQHGPQMQFGNYGLAYLEGLSFWLRALEGTDYQFTPEQCSIVTELLDKGISWCFWKGVMDPSYCGRQCFPDGGRGKAYSMAVAAQNLAAYSQKKGDTDEAERFRHIALQNLEPAKYPNEKVGAVYFNRSDCGCYRTPTWYASVRMSSERTIGYEFTNRENTLAHFSASGAVLLMRSGDEYDNVFACWDWRKVPGVTAYDDGKPIRSSDKREDKQNNSSEVGGFVFDGADCLAAYMQIDRDSLVAFKNVLFTPNCISEEGHGIKTLNPEVKSVTTAIDQVRLVGRVRRGKIRIRTSRGPERCEWVWHNGVCYIALDGAHINVSKDIQTGDWGAIDPAIAGRVDSIRIFKAWIEHPEALADAEGTGSYWFAMIPDVARCKIKKSIKKLVY